MHSKCKRACAQCVYLCNNATTIRPIKYLFLHLAKKRLPKCVFRLCACVFVFISLRKTPFVVDITSAFQLQQLVQIFIPVFVKQTTTTTTTKSVATAAGTLSTSRNDKLVNQQQMPQNAQLTTTTKKKKSRPN